MSHLNQTQTFKDRLALLVHRIYQRLLLAVPKASEFRLAREKTYSFLRAWHYLYKAKVHGDYLEFGVYEGVSFSLALRAAGKFYSPGQEGAPRFYAFDSFQGLPKPSSSRDSDAFQQGEYFSTEKTFKSKIARAARGWAVKTIAGFYSKSLVPSLAKEIKLASFITIDCDLYDSTREALRFSTELLQTGTVIYFDDWFYSHGDMRLGEAGACYDWLAENPHISLVDFGNVGVMGKMFVVNLK